MADTRSVIVCLEQLRREYNLLSQYLTSQTADESARQGRGSHPQEEMERNVKLILERVSQEKEKENTRLIGKLKQELKDSLNDTEILKDVIKRLNEQLNRYHLKHGPIKAERHENIAGDLNRSSIYKLGALLTAYDELLSERDTALKSNAEKFEKVMIKVDSVTSENEKLLAHLERLQKQLPFGSEEAEMVAADARLLLEERELLLQELKILRQQNKREITELQGEVSNFQHLYEESEIKNHGLQADVNSLRAECAELEKKCQGLQKDLMGTVTRQEHQSSIDECQRLFEELRSAYSHESGDLKGRIRAIKQEKKDLAEKLTDSTAQVHNLNVQVSELKELLRKYESKVQRREHMLQAHDTSHRLSQSRIRSLAQSCSELLEDREKLLEALSAQRKETEELSKDVTLRSATVGALSQKLKEERLTWSGRLAESEGSKLAAKSAWKRAIKESNHLRGLISSKDDTIASLIADYRFLGLDLNEAKHQRLKQFLSKSPQKPV